MTFKQAAERSPVWTAAGLLVSGFVTGIGTVFTLLEFLNLEIERQATACPEGTGGLMIVTYPSGAHVDVGEEPYMANMCVPTGRVPVRVAANGFSPETRLVHIGEFDQISVFQLEPVSRLIGIESSHAFMEAGRLTVNLQGIALSRALRIVIEAAGYQADIDPSLEASETMVDLEFVNLRWINAFEEIVNTYGVEIEPDGYTISARLRE